MENSVFNRRIRQLATAIAERIPQDARGARRGVRQASDLAALIMQMRPDVRIEGIDVLVRPAPPHGDPGDAL